LDKTNGSDGKTKLGKGRDHQTLKNRHIVEESNEQV